MKMPFIVSTLLYCYNRKGDVLLVKRNRPPNKGLWSPCGGKVKIDEGESPYQCACREAKEELGLSTNAEDWHLLGIVTEKGYESASHWLMFLFELKRPVELTTQQNDEGEIAFVAVERLFDLPIPETDRQVIWPLVFKYRGGFFSVRFDKTTSNDLKWTLEEVWPKAVGA